MTVTKSQNDCNVCGGQKLTNIAKSKNPEIIGDVTRCENCKLTFVNPLPTKESLDKIYNGLYSGREEYTHIDLLKQKNTRGAFEGYLKKLEKLNFNTKATFADIGGGLGYYSEAAQYHGLEVTLFEPDQLSAQFARDVLSVKRTFSNSMDEFIEETGSRFDIVFVRHVIEHVLDPTELIAGASKLLRDGGMLILETPNNISLEIMLRPRMLNFFLKYFKKNYNGIGIANFFIKRIYALRPPNHLYAFRISNLRQLFEKNGLQTSSAFTSMIGDNCYWPNENKTDIKVVFEALKKFQLKSFVLGLIDVVLYPIRLVVNSMGRSSAICMYAIKKTVA